MFKSQGISPDCTERHRVKGAITTRLDKIIFPALSGANSFVFSPCILGSSLYSIESFCITIMPLFSSRANKRFTNLILYPYSNNDQYLAGKSL